MTPASALSRLEKLATEYGDSFVHDDIQHKAIARDCFKEGYKALLQILSEPGEACKPLSPQIDEMARAALIAVKGENVLDSEVEACLIGLTVGRNTLEEDYKRLGRVAESFRISLNEAAAERDAAKAALASSEARVRILSEELEKAPGEALLKFVRLLQSDAHKLGPRERELILQIAQGMELGLLREITKEVQRCTTKG